MSTPGHKAPARVVVVEDSLVQRAKLIAVLEADADIKVVGEATTALEAIAMVASLRPDVVTLDLNIPAGGGQYALERIMASTPTPILVLSSTVADESSAPAVEALVGGALLAVPKPMQWTDEFESELRRSVRTIRNVPVIRHMRGRLSTLPARKAPTRLVSPAPPAPNGRVNKAASCVVAIAASTGGPPALAAVLEGLAHLQAPVLVVQHIHPDFVKGLVDWMARISPIEVVMAIHGQALRRGCVHIAPGGTHLRIGRDWRIELVDTPATVHRPSADQLFESVAMHAGDRGIGVLLTGMGDDGAVGLAAMHRSGALTIAQDQATSAVFGMPRAAQRLGVVDHQLPLASIAAAILRGAQSRTSVQS